MNRMLFVLTSCLLAGGLPPAAVADDPPTPAAKPRVVGVLIFPNVEALDFCGPYEVFSIAHAHASPPADAAKGATGRVTNLFDVRVVAATKDPVVARGGLTVVPNNTFTDCPKLDILVVPGGRGMEAVLQHKATLDWVRKQAAGAELVTSVCTGAFVLAEAGLLDGKRAATHQMSLTKLRAAYPKVTVVDGARVVRDGNVVTAAGVSSGIDMALDVVARLHGREAAEMAAQVIEYPMPAKGGAK